MVFEFLLDLSFVFALLYIIWRAIQGVKTKKILVGGPGSIWLKGKFAVIVSIGLIIAGIYLLIIVLGKLFATFPLLFR